MRTTNIHCSNTRRLLLIAAACMIGAATVAWVMMNRTDERAIRPDGRTGDGPTQSPGTGWNGSDTAPAVGSGRPRPARTEDSRSGLSGDAAVIERKVMPHILAATRGYIENNISADQTELNAAERDKNAWLYQRLGLDKDREARVLAILRKKEACLQKAMETASVTNEDEAAYAGLKPYQDELDAELRDALGDGLGAYQKLGDAYEMVTNGNGRLPDEKKLSDAQAHRLADLISEVHSHSSRDVGVPTGEEEDHDVTLRRAAEADTRIRQGAAAFLTPEQIDAFLSPGGP